MRINIRNIIDFCDNDLDAQPYSAAIKGFAFEELCLALLFKHFSDQGQRPTLEGKCNGVHTRHRLDGWISVTEHNRPVNYQVEVKSWSFHGYGERRTPLDVDCTPEDLSLFMEEKYLQYWSEPKGRFVDPKLDKVLYPMKRDHLAGDVRPLACLWTPIHKDGKIDEPFFPIEGVQNPPGQLGVFDTVWIFSVSAYLRKLLREGGSDIIDLTIPTTDTTLLPKATQTMAYLRGLFPGPI